MSPPALLRNDVDIVFTKYTYVYSKKLFRLTLTLKDKLYNGFFIILCVLVLSLSLLPTYSLYYLLAPPTHSPYYLLAPQSHPLVESGENEFITYPDGIN